MSQKYILKQDEDCHWYLIRIKDVDKFDSLCEYAYSEDDFEGFERMFSECRINGPHDLTFTDPRDTNGDSL